MGRCILNWAPLIEKGTTLTYLAEVEPLANGELVNSAYATGGTLLLTLRAQMMRVQHRVDRNGGIFGDQGVVLGTVS